MRRTRACTRVFFDVPEPDEDIEFKERRYEIVKSFGLKYFRTDISVKPEETEDMLKTKLKELTELKQARTQRPPEEPCRAKQTWKEKVERKRRKVEEYIRLNPKASIKDVCRYALCSYQLARRAIDFMQFTGHVESWTPPNLKQEMQIQQLNDTIAEVEGTYSTVTEIKRRNPCFSRKWILRRLHATGHRYHLLAKKRKVEKEPRHSSKEVLAVVRHLAQCMANERVETFYVDEVHFPLYQTALRHWTTGEQQEELVYNRRSVPDTKISAIALCDLEKFRAVQFFERDITADDFAFFMQEFLVTIGKPYRVSILLDNATWHKSNVIEQSGFKKLLFFNAPGLFQANPIENCFSFVRACFRKRPLVHSNVEEARLLAGIFFDSANIRKFEGISRNHLRSLLRLLYHHEMAIASRRPVR